MGDRPDYMYLPYNWAEIWLHKEEAHDKEVIIIIVEMRSKGMNFWFHWMKAAKVLVVFVSRIVLSGYIVDRFVPLSFTGNDNVADKERLI